MAQLPLDQAITRFQSNENRLDTFANGGVADGYVSTAGIPVPSIQKFLAAKDTQINVGASSVLALATAQAEDAEDSAIAAAASAAVSSGAASAAVANFAVSLASSTGADSVGFKQLFPGSVIGTVGDKLAESVSVKDFGAVGNSNGTTGNGADDTAAIQAALDYMGSSGGGTVKLVKTSGFYRITSGLKIPSYVTLEGLSPSRFPFNGAGATSGLLADFSNPNQWVIEPKTTIGGLPVAYNAVITGLLPDGATYNCCAKNFQINVPVGGVVPFGAVRMHGCPGSVVDNVSAVGTGAGLLVNFCFGGSYVFHGLTKYYGAILWSNANANNAELYCTQMAFLNTVPAGYVMPFMTALNGTLVSSLKLTTESHANRSWGLIVGGTASDVSANNNIDITIEEFGGNVFQNYSYGTVFGKTYMESASLSQFGIVGANSLFSTASFHHYNPSAGAIFDLGVNVRANMVAVGLVDAASAGTVTKDASTLLTIGGPDPENFCQFAQPNVCYTSQKPGWIAPTLVNSWANAGAPSPNAGYRLNQRTGNVELRGYLNAGVINGAAFVLPSGYRPAARMYFATMSQTGLGAITVLATGEVIPSTPGTNAGISLDGVTFLAEQ